MPRHAEARHGEEDKKEKKAGTGIVPAFLVFCPAFASRTRPKAMARQLGAEFCWWVCSVEVAMLV